MVADGASLFAPAVTRRLIARVRAAATPRAAARSLGELTPREREVCCCWPRACRTPRSPRRSWSREHTVKTHVAHILAKLDLRDRAQAVVLAYESGVVKPGG